jgi:hypothetical protein
MPCFICVTCGPQFAETDERPEGQVGAGPSLGEGAQ